MIDNTYMTAVNSALYQNQVNKFYEIQRDYYKVQHCADSCHNAINKIEQIQCDYYQNNKGKEKQKNLRSLLDVFPMFRRTERIPNKIEKKDNVAAVGLASLAALNFPEDLRDTKSAYNQIKTKVEGGLFKYHYDYKKAQHPFSFFRGTLLHSLLDSKTSPFPNFAKKVVNLDKTLYDTKIGRLADKLFGISLSVTDTGIKNMTEYPKYIKAYQYKTKSLAGELTARALTRTPIIGAVALAGIEAAHFKKEMDLGKNVKKELAQSAVTYASSLAGIGYGGAIGAKYFGPVGSVVGMGIGAIAANKISNYIDT